MFKVTYKLKNLKEEDMREIDKFCIESNEEVTRLANHWSMKKWADYIKMILFVREDNSLSIIIPNPIKVPGSFMRQFTKKLKVEKNLEKWLKENGFNDYEKVREGIK